MSAESPAPVLLYDGVCGVCNRSVRAILRFDPTGPLRFAALQSVFAKAIIERHPEIGNVDSVVFVDEDRKSTRLNSSHVEISYAVFCLKKKKRACLRGRE